MFDQTVRNVMQRRKIVLARPDTDVAAAARLMASKNVGAVMVVENDQLVGIFTERDLLVRVVAKSLDAASTPVGDVMTREPLTIGPDKPFGTALAVMHERGFRHLPVVEDSRIVGIVSARSAMDPELEEFESEALRRKRYLDLAQR
jgi:CBS domain-containing protein